ncbi:unnamed protein product [Candida verbasci]|uniref:Major facilitator superfamily (MFS) profile domain-containing protein n=1 Tax=Candida verbasci TaxID=1227364 RepID=A0A9W4X8F5_9ASCO|nr:unnamed protein product [Candida verbasci]
MNQEIIEINTNQNQTSNITEYNNNNKNTSEYDEKHIKFDQNINFNERTLPGTPSESISTTIGNREVKAKDLADKLGDAHFKELRTSQIITVLLTLSLATIVSFADQTGITVGLSTIGKDLNAEQSINWAGSASLLANTVCQVLFGRMSDIFGRKAVIMSCLMILVIGDIACGVARNAVEFFVFRALAGIGNGGVSSLSMVILSDIVSLKDRGKYQGILGSSVGIGNAVGPFIMSAFIKKASWRAYYYFLAPLGFVVNIILFFALKDNKKVDDVLSRKEKFKNIDYFGILAATAGLTLLLVPLNGGGSTYRWDSTLVIVMFTIGGVILILFLGIEAKFAKLPMIPLKLFKSPSLCLLYLATFCFGATYFSFTYYLPYYFQIVKGKDELHTSIFLLPLVLCQAGFSAVGGNIISFTGHYFYIVTIGYGLWLISAGLLLLWNQTLNDGINVLILLIMGIGVGFSFQPSMVSIQANCKRSERAVAISTRNVLRSFGGCVGIAAGSTIVSNSVLKELDSTQSQSILNEDTINYIKSHIYEKIDISNLNHSQVYQVRQMYVDALHNYFYFIIALMAVCFLTAFFVKDRGLQCIDEEPINKKNDLELSASSTVTLK